MYSVLIFLYISSESLTTSVVNQNEPCACGRGGDGCGENIMTRTHYYVVLLILLCGGGGIAIFGTDDLGLYILPHINRRLIFDKREEKRKI